VHESWRIADELERKEERERARCKAAEEEKATTEEESEESEDSEADEHKTEEDKTEEDKTEEDKRVEGERGKATKSGHKLKRPKGRKGAPDGQTAERDASHVTQRHDCSLKGSLVPVEREGEGNRGRDRERGMERERHLEMASSKEGGGAGEASCSGLQAGRTSVPRRGSRY